MSKIILPEDIKGALGHISQWWEGNPMNRPCYALSVPKSAAPNLSLKNLQEYWPSHDEEPDFEGLVERMIENIEANCYFGEAIPVLPHLWGGRGAPMAMAAYLGGKVNLREDTVWVEPIIDDWREFELCFDERNIWLKKSLEFFKLAVERSNGNYLPHLPDFGDALTVLSLLRGVDRLLVDLIENKEAVLEARDKFVELWPKFHRKFWEPYSRKFPGDISWLVWAPGKTYACQCDFSTMISPQMFIEFVVPEIEAMDKYLDYIVWHLDGQEELKHLDILLDLSEIKVIQWVPGSGNPPAASPQWLPMLKRIQGKGKGLVVYAENEEEIRFLLKELSPKGLFIFDEFSGRTREEALKHIEIITKLSKKFNL